MNMRTAAFLTALIISPCFNADAQEQPAVVYPKIFWENNADKGAILISPVEIVLVDSKGDKYGKVLAKDEIDSVYMSSDGKKLVYTTASEVWLVKIENGETRLVAKGYCDYLRWNTGGSSFLFAIGEYKNDKIPVVLSLKFFWADGDGKNLKQVHP